MSSRVWKAKSVNGKCTLVRKVPKKKKVSVSAKEAKKRRAITSGTEARAQYLKDLDKLEKAKEKANKKDLAILKALSRISEQAYNKATEVEVQEEVQEEPSEKGKADVQTGIPRPKKVQKKKPAFRDFGAEAMAEMDGRGKRVFAYGDWSPGDTAKYGPLPEWVDETKPIPSRETLPARHAREWKNFNNAADKFKARIPYLDLDDSFTQWVRVNDPESIRGGYYLSHANKQQLKNYSTKVPWARWPNPYEDPKLAEYMAKNIIRVHDEGTPFWKMFKMFGGGLAYHDAINEILKGNGKKTNKILSKIISVSSKEGKDEDGPDLEDFLNARSLKKTSTKQLVRTMKISELAKTINKIRTGKDVDLDIDIDAGQEGGAITSKKGEGLTGTELDELMKEVGSMDHTKQPLYIGAFANDRLPNPDADRFGYIANTDNASGPGKHWVAVYVDKKSEKEINYYDPFGDDPSREVMAAFKNYVSGSPHMLKLKINSVNTQDVDSDSCGWLAANFLKKRFRNVSFKEATGFVEPTADKSPEFESEVNNMQKSFGFV